MKQGQKPWTRDELILAVNLYCKLPFGKMHKSNKDIIQLSTIIDRTPSSIALKLGNFASFDPSLQQRGIRGASNASKLDKVIWDEFYNNWDAALLESEQLLAQRTNTTIEKLNDVTLEDLPPAGRERERLVKVRVNQCIFRKVVLATYSNKCCITGLELPELLVASHIRPWSIDNTNRLNPSNGLALNSLHDKAFDRGLLTIDATTYTVKLSPAIEKSKLAFMNSAFLQYANKRVLLPDKFLPSQEFLHYHNENVFCV